MSRTRIVGGKITEIVGGEYNIYSKGPIILTSLEGSVNITARQGITHGNPGTAPTVNKITTECIVEFRTKQDGSYTGQFGFDWLREDDNGLTTEAKYYDCLENGYEAPNGRAPHRDVNTEYESKDEAFKALQKEYNKIPIDIIPRPATAPFTKDYFVPYLNLFPKPYSDAATVPTGMPKPPFEAELRTLVEVGGTDEPDQIRIVFDKRYFEINGKDGSDANPVLISDKALGAKREATADTIKIKCIEGFTTKQEIKVFVYPKGTLAKPAAEQIFARKLAGEIIVLPNKNTTGQNAVKNIKEEKFVFVQVRTNLLGGLTNIKLGIFTDSEKKSFRNSLYQSLIFPKIEDKDTSGNILTFDLTTDIDYSRGGKFDLGGKYNEDYRSGATDKVPHFFKDMRTKFLALLGNSKYKDYFTVFVIADDVYDNAAGQIQEIGIKNLVLFKGRNDLTLSHEGLHGLGLFHAHKDGVITNPNQKFAYKHAHTDSLHGTDNIMSYNGVLRKTTWKWQWEIIKKNAK
ncbi:hypothetical protein Pf1_00470 [Flavobacterium columnare]|uniref:hypothetical protein n=1 Tax=Flavobacterium columnare TaxID=996 RepID=UPI0007F997B9|nr:hypothetical protein [Flavobacterium columnare]ANO48718.1 hypothetical protein Pf1_00470 [Flavobacterium columnare]APT23247.1 hypothetical protein BU993_11820 [Flavobacterium columnare]